MSFSSHYVGHAFGPNSRENEELVLAEDKILSRLFNFLAKKTPGGLKNIVFVLTADHGVAPNAEWLEPPGFSTLGIYPSVTRILIQTPVPLETARPAIKSFFPKWGCDNNSTKAPLTSIQDALLEKIVGGVALCRRFLEKRQIAWDFVF